MRVGPVRAGPEPAALPAPVRAVTFDVGNTLLPFRRREMEALLRGFVAFIRDRVGPCDEAEVIARYDAVRAEQYRANLPHLRENDLIERIRLTLEAVPGVGAGRASPELLGEAVEAYLGALVSALPLPDYLPGLLEHLGRRYRLGVITNYPYSPGTRRLLQVKGLRSFFDSVVISADWEFVKPHPLLFRQAAHELGVEPEAILHVGDDWEADVIGATRAGAQAALFTGLRDEPDPRRGDPEGKPLAVIDRLTELPALLDRLPGPLTGSRAASPRRGGPRREGGPR